jgi:hypothetical protein
VPCIFKGRDYNELSYKKHSMSINVLNEHDASDLIYRNVRNYNNRITRVRMHDSWANSNVCLEKKELFSIILCHRWVRRVPSLHARRKHTQNWAIWITFVTRLQCWQRCYIPSSVYVITHYEPVHHRTTVVLVLRQSTDDTGQWDAEYVYDDDLPLPLGYLCGRVSSPVVLHTLAKDQRNHVCWEWIRLLLLASRQTDCVHATQMDKHLLETRVLDARGRSNELDRCWKCNQHVSCFGNGSLIELLHHETTCRTYRIRPLDRVFTRRVMRTVVAFLLPPVLIYQQEVLLQSMRCNTVECVQNSEKAVSDGGS